MNSIFAAFADFVGPNVEKEMLNAENHLNRTFVIIKCDECLLKVYMCRNKFNSTFCQCLFNNFVLAFSTQSEPERLHFHEFNNVETMLSEC